MCKLLGLHNENKLPAVLSEVWDDWTKYYKVKPLLNRTCLIFFRQGKENWKKKGIKNIVSADISTINFGTSSSSFILFPSILSWYMSIHALNDNPEGPLIILIIIERLNCVY